MIFTDYYNIIYLCNTRSGGNATVICTITVISLTRDVKEAVSKLSGLCPCTNIAVMSFDI